MENVVAFARERGYSLIIANPNCNYSPPLL